MVHLLIPASTPKTKETLLNWENNHSHPLIPPAILLNAFRRLLPPFPSASPLWSRTVKNIDCSTGPLARPFARLLTPLTRSLAPDCLLRSRPPLRSLVRSLALFAHSLARGNVNDWMAIFLCFFFHFGP